MFKIKKSKGFTLIELLVVIGIFGLLAIIITMNVQSVSQKARCAKRRADIVSLQVPLEAYYDANKSYPNTGSIWWSLSPYSSGGAHDVTGPNGWIPNLAPTYIQRLPSDPVSSGSLYYAYMSDGSAYAIIAYTPNLDGCILGDSKDTLYDPVHPTWAWKVCSGEPACSSW